MNVLLLCYTSLSVQLIDNYYKYYSGKLIHLTTMEYAVIESQLSEEWLKESKIDLVTIIGNAYQKSDFLFSLARKSTIPFFFPSKDIVTLETSKILTKKLLHKLDIPTAPFKVFLGKDIKKDKNPLVVKYDADYLGDQTEIVFDSFVLREQFENKSVLVEEFLSGEEFTYQVICNGSSFTFFGISRDYKKYKRKNTCGIASISNQDQKSIPEINSYIEKILRLLNSTGIPYCGVMNLNIMKVDNTYYVLEINTRFGDPETQSLYPTTDTNLFNLFFLAATSQPLPNIDRTGMAGVCIQLIHKDYNNLEKDMCIYPTLVKDRNIQFGDQLIWSKKNVFGSLTASAYSVEDALRYILSYLEDKHLGDYVFTDSTHG